LEDSRDNRRRWKRQLDELERELIRTRWGTSGTLDLSRWFPKTRLEYERTPSGPQIFGDLARQWLEQLPGTSIGAPTREQYAYVFGAHVLQSELAKVPLAELTAGHIKLWLGELRRKKTRTGKPLEANTVNKILARLRTMVTEAWRSGSIPRSVNPMELVKNLPMEGREPEPFLPDELLALFSACQGQQRTLYMLLALTGLRPSEALGLWWQHIDYENGHILVRQQLREDGAIDHRLKTPRSVRDVLMLEPVRTALSQLALQNRLRSRFVFCNRQGGPLLERTQGDDPWRKAIKRADLNYRTLYTLRHTFTFLMLSAGKPLPWVADQLGHVGVRKIDEVYGRWTRNMRPKLAAEQLDLDEFFKAIRSLPPSAAEVPPELPQICRKSSGDNHGL
jgi:integrase